jgi:glutathione peroxidase
MTEKTVYDFTVKDSAGKPVSLRDYEGKVLLIVNTATHCGFTPTYQDLEALYRKYREEGFEILDFPCNQFAGQAPETIDEINSFCSLNYHTDFTRFAKVEVNGEQADPLFLFLESQKAFKGFDKGHPLAPVLSDINLKADPAWAKKPSIKWNFTKFLIGRDGTVFRRFEPTAPKEKLESAIASLLNH